MKKHLLILLTALLSTAPLLAQYSPCYEAAFAEGQKQFEAGKYTKALKYFNEAKDCPDSNKVAADEWIGKCNTKIRKAEEARQKAEQERIEAATGSANGHDYVDLGLPSGTLWATCNVGASKPEGYGNYYAWGETSTKSTYNWENYRYAQGTWENPRLTKYCSDSRIGNNGFTDNLTTLQSSDDAATANWGDGWRMPTYDEWAELYNNTISTWTTLNGKKGRLFTSKKNGATLFLPAAGYRYSELNDAGSHGYYWSRSPNTGNSPSSAWRLVFHSDNCFVGSGPRYYGCSVRPVREK